MIDNKLTEIDFAAAVRSDLINKNFEVVNGWMKRERLRTSGFGLVEGFDMTYNNDYAVSISAGVLIDENGDEIITDSAHIYCGKPTYTKMSETLKVQEGGIIELRYPPYSYQQLKLITYNPPQDTSRVDPTEFKIENATTPASITPLVIEDNLVTVSDSWVGKHVVVSYYCCPARIDAILLDSKGRFSREIGIGSESPSVADVKLDGRFFIGFAVWSATRDGIGVEFIVNERAYRKVYTNKLNELFLNGKKYTDPKWIYFTEPEKPQENDVWYDYKSNTLCIWSRKNNIWGWRIVNDFSEVPIRTVKIWTPEECPDDLQTFIFGEEELDYQFIPNTNALEIVIDQQVVMKDQYEEVLTNEKDQLVRMGKGFKLSAPLDRPTTVECTITHIVKNGALKSVYQRAAIFTDENYFVYSPVNKKQVFQTKHPYAIGASQLEVFLNGKRLKRDIDFHEMVDEDTLAAEKDKDDTTIYFKIEKQLSPGDEITYKISRYVWSYNQLATLLQSLEESTQKAVLGNQQVMTAMENVEKSIDDKIANVQVELAQIQEALGSLDNYRKKRDVIKLSDLSRDLRATLFKNTESFIYNATVSKVLDDFSKNDYIILFVSNAEESHVLSRPEEYSIVYNNDGSAKIELKNTLISAANTIMGSVIRFGL